MENNIIHKINGRNYIKIELMPITQKNKEFYLAKIPAYYFTKIYTVEPAVYDFPIESAIAATFDTPENYFKHRLDIDKKQIDKKEFERKLDLGRVHKIAQWLEEDDYALFPNTVIVTCDLMNDSLQITPDATIEEIIVSAPDEVKNLSFLEESKHSGENTYLYIPFAPDEYKSVLVIDGQHRLRGLDEAGDSIQNNYDLLVSFILGFDRSVIAKLFYTINYEQKSVNKSLLYHLSGEFSRDINEKTFLHEVVRTLNEVSQSPFYKRVKMLGTVDPKATLSEKKLMTISQAFLIDYLVSTISKGTKDSNTIYPPIFLYYYENVNMQVEIVRFLLKYFRAIREINRESWDNPENSIICKTVGIGALLRVLHLFFVKIFVERLIRDPLQIQQISTEELIEKLDGLQNVDFTKSGPYGGIASGGTLNKLKEEIVENIKYFGLLPYDQFIETYRGNYLTQFRNWLSKRA